MTYCAANNIIRKYTDKLSETYPYVVIDNEAGMEHLSRRTTHKVDVLLIVSDPSLRGLRTAKRIHNLVDELGLDIGRRAVVVNRISEKEWPELNSFAVGSGLEIAGTVPQDPEIARFDLQGKPVLQLPDDSSALPAFYRVLDSLDIK